MSETTTSPTNKKLLFLGIGILAVGAASYFMLSDTDAPKTVEQQVVVQGAIEPTPEPEPEITAPVEEVEEIAVAEPEIQVPQPVALNKSDAPFTDALVQLAPAHPVKDWASPNQLIRKTVALIDGMSRGELVFKNRPIESKAVKGEFKVDSNNGEMVLSATNFARYDQLISALEYVDTDTAITLYKFWSPRLEEAFSELGMPGDFNRALDKALTQLIDAPIVEGRVVLVRPSVYYKFKDPQLEQLNDLQKLMIRVGPANAKRIQAKLIEIRGELRKQNQG